MHIIFILNTGSTSRENIAISLRQ